jgi:hypothetical protein
MFPMNFEPMRWYEKGFSPRKFALYKMNAGSGVVEFRNLYTITDKGRQALEDGEGESTG